METKKYKMASETNKRDQKHDSTKMEMNRHEQNGNGNPPPPEYSSLLLSNGGNNHDDNNDRDLELKNYEKFHQVNDDDLIVTAETSSGDIEDDDDESSTETQQKRETWTRGIDFVVACIGGSVGLGNVWRFPYLCYKNGGGAFLIPYFTCMIFCSIPLFILECSIGQYMSAAGTTAWNIIPVFQGIGLTTTIIIFYMCLYYNNILGWAIMYLFHSFSSTLPWSTCDSDWNTEHCTTDFNAMRLNNLNNSSSNSNSNNTISSSNNNSNSSYTNIPSNSNDINSNNISASLNPLDLLSSASSNLLSEWTTGSPISSNGSTGFIPESTISLLNNINSTVTESQATSMLVDPVIEFWERKVLAISPGITEMGTTKWDRVLCFFLAWVITYCCICKGIKSSGKVMYITAPAPFIFMTVILIRNAMLDGAYEGVKYYLQPDLSKLTDMSVWIDAGTQIFFSSAVCQNVVTALGSYNKFKHNLVRDSIIFSIVNSFTSIFSGFLVFTILGFMAQEQGKAISEVAESGPGLAFIAYPKAVAQMPLPQLWSAIFFVMVLFLGLDSQFLGVETTITALVDMFPGTLRRGHRREIFVACLCAIMFVIGTVFTLNGGMYVFTMFDSYCAGINLIFLGFLESIAIAYCYGFRRFFDNLEMMIGHRWTKISRPYLTVCWLFTTPLLCFMMFILGLGGHRSLTYNRANKSVYHFPGWADSIGWMLTLSSVIWIPVFFLHKLYKYGCNMEVLRLMFVPYSLKSHQMRPQDSNERSLKTLEIEQELHGDGLNRIV